MTRQPGQTPCATAIFHNGPGATTSEAEMYLPSKFFEGTYATRIYFNDTPASARMRSCCHNILQHLCAVPYYDLDPITRKRLLNICQRRMGCNRLTHVPDHLGNFPGNTLESCECF